MKHGIQTRIAQKAQISLQLLNHYIHGRKNASGPIADRLASLTGTDIRDWLKGGDPAKRRAAVEKWQKA